MSRAYDVFNGDADGLCALQQLRLEAPCEATLVTGPKRDIALLARVDARAGDRITVLDVSLDRNREWLVPLLERGARVTWFDHHYAGEIPRHPALEAHIDTAPDVCTSLLVDRAIAGARRPWAIAAAFGDGLIAVAHTLARASGLMPEAIARLRALGEAINYNSYGETEADLNVAPAALYAAMREVPDALEFAASRLAQRLVSARAEDLDAARAIAPIHEDARNVVLVLPDAPSSRRVVGTLANELAERAPAKAHAVLVPNASGGYVVSLRAPRDKPRGADRVCRAFAGGGGRESAAGIDHLPLDALDEFIARMNAATWG